MKDGHESVSVRRINNGFLVDHHKDGPSGYECKTEFTPTEPKIRSAKVLMDGGSTDTTGFNRHSSQREIDEAINGKAFR